MNSGQFSSNRCGLGFNSSVKRNSQNNGIKFVPATVGVNPDQPAETKVVCFSSKLTSWVCHYCSKRGHIQPLNYALQRYRFQHQKASYHT